MASKTCRTVKGRGAVYAAATHKYAVTAMPDNIVLTPCNRFHRSNIARVSGPADSMATAFNRLFKGRIPNRV